MKRHINIAIKTMPLLLLGTGVLTGCHKRSGDERVAIRLTTVIQARTAIDRFETTPVSIIAGSKENGLDEYWQGVASGSEITLTPRQYYPSDGSTLYLRAFYPQAKINDGSASYTLSGNEDLLYADKRSGSLDKPFHTNTQPLSFRHLLVQLSAILKVDNNFPTEYRLKSISVNGSAVAASLDLKTGQLSFPDKTAPLYIFHAEDYNDSKPLKPGDSLPLGYILVQPGTELKLDIVMAKDNSSAHDWIMKDITLEFEGGSTSGGQSYQLNITIPVSLTLTAVLTDWTDSDNGTGNVTVPKTESFTNYNNQSK